MNRGAPRAPFGAAVLLGLAAVAAFTASPTSLQAPGAEPLGHSVTTQLGGEGSCDVDGVAVSYEAEYRSSPEPAGYRVAGATVDGIAPTCEGANLRVELLDGTQQVVATGYTVVGSSASAAVEITPQAHAEAVDSVSVEIAGGSVPIPSVCAQMRLDTVRVGTTGADVLDATNDRDLVFGLDGPDQIAGGNLNDCLDGGPGDDQIDAGTYDDAVLGGAGNDHLTGGVGKDELLGGPGDDTLDGGPGNDHINGGDGTDRCSGGQGNNRFTSCEVITP